MRSDGLIAFKGIDSCDFQQPTAHRPDNPLRSLYHQPLPAFIPSSSQDDIGVFDKVAAYALSRALLCQCKQLAVSAPLFIRVIL